MRFRDPKLHLSEESNLRKVERSYFKPYVVLVSPVYVKLSLNEKFVAIKAPLQFFTEEELKNWASHEYFYMPGFVDQVALYQSAGVSVRKLLSIHETVDLKVFKEGKIHNQKIQITSSSVVQNNETLKLLAPLWGTSISIEPFFASFCGNEVCDAFQGETLLRAENVSVENFELSFVRANSAVFFALHLGWRNIADLTKFRDWVFLKSIGESNIHEFLKNGPEELVGLIDWSIQLIPKVDSVQINRKVLKKSKLLTSHVLLNRLNRIEKQGLHLEQVSYSIFGKEGITSVA